MSLVSITEALVRELAPLEFAAPVTHVYNPLVYAWAPHAQYLERFGRGTRDVVWLGMNPGPWGMAQTGVPFGEVSLARDWLGISGDVAGAPEAADPGLRVHAQRGQRRTAVGLRPRHVGRARALLRRALHRELLPPRLHGGERQEPHARQAAAAGARRAEREL
jgi:single-strand selective monofunctional uracil DNA glycosylase